jgi:hypothetical protein
VVGFAALLTLGEAASQIAERYGAPLFALAALERGLWTPEKCPLCKSGDLGLRASDLEICGWSGE